MFTDLRNDLSYLSANMSSAMNNFEEIASITEKPSKEPDVDVGLLATHDYIELIVASNMVDHTLGFHIFPHTTSGYREHSCMNSIRESSRYHRQK